MSSVSRKLALFAREIWAFPSKEFLGLWNAVTDVKA